MVCDCRLQMLLRRPVSWLLRLVGPGKEVTYCRSYLTDGAPVIGSEPDRSLSFIIF